MIRKCLVVLFFLLVWLQPTAAQEPNLLNNPTFENGVYYNSETPLVSGSIPHSWGVWSFGQNFSTDLKTDPWMVHVHSPGNSWIMRDGFNTWTGGGKQTVDVQQGRTYRFSIWAYQWTCDDSVLSCIHENQPQFSHQESGAAMRIGIDPTGGTDPNGGNVVWSGFVQPWNHYESLAVEAVARSNRMTVFTYATAQKGMFFREHLWDDASLTAVSAPVANPGNNAGNSGNSGGSSSGNPQPVNTAPRATAVPVQVSAESRPDGSSVHIVQSGQSLWSISQAYGVSLNTLREMNGLVESSVIHPGDEIIVEAGTTQQVVAVQPTNPAPTITPTSAATEIAIALPPLSAASDDDAVDVAIENEGKSETPLFLAGGVILIGVVTMAGIVGLVGVNVFRRR